MTSRRLAAILAADVVGYSRLIGADEAGTLARLRALRGDVVDPLVAENGGRIFKTTGDGLLAEFSSVVQALRCAMAVQERLRGEELQLRIGVHQGDVVVEGDDLLGDGVNVAARLEGLAEPGGICISSRVREDAVGKLALEVEDLGEPELKNIAQRHRVFRVRLGAPERPALALPDKPSLAVLPFQNMSGDPEQEYFADGVVEDIITALSRTGWLLVIARNSSFTYKGRAVGIKQVGRELGVRYILEGSIRKAGNRVRITTQLIETATGGHVWADRFDGALADIFDLQDRITENIVGALEPSVRRAEIARANAKPTANLDAYDCYLRALEQHNSFTRAGNDAALALLRRAFELDPGYTLAKALFADVSSTRYTIWGATPEEIAVGLAVAQEAVAAGRDDPLTLRWAARSLVFLGRDFDQAVVTINRAVALSPGSPEVLASAGFVYCLAHEPEKAIEFCERAMRLSPLDPQVWRPLQTIGLAHLQLGRTEEALPLLLRGVQENPRFAPGYRTLIVAYVRLGRFDEARAAAASLLKISPRFRISDAPRAFRNEAFFGEMLAAYRLAGLPE